MRTLCTLLACAVCGAVASAALPPKPTDKTFDVAHLIGDDAPFATIEDLRMVVAAVVFSHGHGDEGRSVQIDPDTPTKLKVCEFESGHWKVEQFLATLHEVKRRRGMVVSTECLMLRMPAGGGEELLLPQECDRPLKLTEREAELTDKLVRHTKADVVGRRKLDLPHGRERSVVEYTRTLWNLPTFLDPRVSVKLKATISDDGKSVTLAGGVEQIACADYHRRTTHEGKFKGEVPVGGTAVVKVSPKMVDDKAATDEELYVLVRVREVRPAVPESSYMTKVEVPPGEVKSKSDIPPVPAVVVPLPVGVTTVEVPPLPVSVPKPPVAQTFSFGNPPPEVVVGRDLQFVVKHDTVFTPTGEQSTLSSRFTLLTRNPFLGTSWGDKPKPAERKDYWGMQPFGIEWNY